MIPIFHTWTIDNLESYYEKFPENFSHIDSAIFFSPLNDKFKFYLRIYPKGDCLDNQAYICCDLYVVSTDFTESRLKWKLIAQDSFQNEIPDLGIFLLKIPL